MVSRKAGCSRRRAFIQSFFCKGGAPGWGLRCLPRLRECFTPRLQPSAWELVKRPHCHFPGEDRAKGPPEDSVRQRSPLPPPAHHSPPLPTGQEALLHEVPLSYSAGESNCTASPLCRVLSRSWCWRWVCIL